MSTIRFPGLFTGIDTQSLISQLMALERRTINVYEQRKATWEEKKSALSTLETKLGTLRSSVRALSDADKLRAFNTSSSDEDKVTADASYNAFEGTHTIVVNQLAASERWVHTAGLEYAEDYTGAGTLIYSYNHTETSVTTTATTTLEDLVGLINNDANNPGVTANLLYYNEAYHLVLNGNEAGTDYEISINASNTEVWQSVSAFTAGDDNATLSTKIVGLDQFDYNGGSLAGDERIRITGHQHDGTAIDVYMDVNSNTKLFHVIEEVNDAFSDTATATLENGNIVLTDHTYGASQMDLTLTYDPGTGPTTLSIPSTSRLTEGGSVTADLTDFAETDFTETQAAQDSQIKVDGYPTGVDEWITRSSNTIDDVIHGVTLHLHDTTDATGEQITQTRDIDLVKSKLTSMIDAYNLAIDHIKKTTGYDDILKTAGVLMGDYIVSTVRSQILTPLYTQTNGFIEDVDTFLMPAQIGLELDKDGLLSLDTNAFSEAIAEDYLGTLAIIGADKTGSSNSSQIEFYGASSNYTTAGEYNVEADFNVGGILSAVRIKLSSESSDRNMTISGNIATGNSTFDDNGDPVYPENGLQLTVPTTGTPSSTITATVRVKQGFAGAIEDALNRMLKATIGSIPIDQEHVDDQIEVLQDKIEDEEYRLTKRETRLVTRFARLERTLALMQNQMAALGFITT